LRSVLTGLNGKIEAGGIGAVDDVDIVVSGQDQHAFSKNGICGDDVEKLGPFGGEPRVGHVAADEDEVEWLGRVQGRQPLHRADKAVISARSRSSAFDAKAVALADDMDVGEMRDPPDASGVRWHIESLEIERLVAGRLGEAPDERGDRQIGGHDEDYVRYRPDDEEMRRHEVGDGAGPVCERPCGESDRGRNHEHEQPRGGAASCAYARKLGACSTFQRALDQVPHGLAPERVAGLNRERVQRPEILLRHAKQGAPAEPGDQ
jgi:hypothetical protein